jgi:lipopolysaccharide transport system permease protein
MMQWARYRDIVLYRAYAELKAEAQLNYMGCVWWLLEPLLNTVLFYVLLVVVLEQQAADSISFVLIGAIIWQWTSSCVLTSAGSILDAGGMLQHVYLPKIILPLIVLLSTTWKFLFIFLLLLGWVWAAGHPPTLAYAALPGLLLVQMMVNVVASLAVAALIPYFPDARLVVDAFLRSLMIVSGIFFPIEKLPAWAHFYFYLNPLADLIQAYRNVLLHGQWPAWWQLGWVTVFCALGLVFLAAFYRRIDLSVIKAIHR